MTKSGSVEYGYRSGPPAPVYDKEGSGKIVGWHYACGMVVVDIDQVDFTIRNPATLRRLREMDAAQRHAAVMFATNFQPFNPLR